MSTSQHQCDHSQCIKREENLYHISENKDKTIKQLNEDIKEYQKREVSR
jgi:hypothetical protein